MTGTQLRNIYDEIILRFGQNNLPHYWSNPNSTLPPSHQEVALALRHLNNLRANNNQEPYTFNGTNLVSISANNLSTTPMLSNGQANAATYPRLTNQIHEQNLRNIAAQDPRLATAIRENGNFSIGRATREEADRLGMIWVGDGARPTSGGGWISRDGTRQYRPPTNKRSPFAITGVQANFETFRINPITGEKIQIKNGHLNID